MPAADAAICPHGSRFAAAVAAVRDCQQSEDEAVAGLVEELTEEELLGILDGDATSLQGLAKFYRWSRGEGKPFEAGRVDRLGIPGLRFTDGPRGVFIVPATAFPVAIARAASWDPELERRVADTIGAEARAAGANLFAGICVNLPPFPGWGRTQESYGEDPLLQGAMGAAATEGVNPWTMSCVKHFALNSMEEARFWVDVQVDDDVLHEVYLPHFCTVVEAGVDSVMSAYNSVNGIWAGENAHLLTEILRDEWGFTGFVQTDWVWGLRDPIASVAAGQDVEMPFRQQRAATLPAALDDGRLAREDVTRAAHRVIRAQLRLALRARPTPSRDVIASPEHRALSREAARRGAVLLRNESVDGAPALPLPAGGRVAVLGRLADAPNMGDVGSSNVRAPSSVSVRAGLRERLGSRVVDGDVDTASRCDAAVVVVGLSATDEGESVISVDPDTIKLMGRFARIPGVATAITNALAIVARIKDMPGGDRHDLRLHREDVELIEAVAAVNRRTVVVLIGGATLVLDPWDAEVAAILYAWYPGMEGGRAVADLLLGDAEPGGRLPLAIPHRQADLPTVDWRARRVTYPRWWGQRKLDRDGVQAAYPLGFGLGYTTFALSDLRVGVVAGESFAVEVTVTNTGSRPGRHVVQCYARLPGHERIVRALLGFRSVEVRAGESVTASVACSTRPLQRWDGTRFVIDYDEVTVEAGASSGDPQALVTVVEACEGSR